MPDTIKAELIIPGDILEKPNGTIVIDRDHDEDHVLLKTDEGTLKFPRKERVKIYNYD